MLIVRLWVCRGIAISWGRGMVGWGMMGICWGRMTISRSRMGISGGRVTISWFYWRIGRWVSVGKLSGIGQRDQGENGKELKIKS